MSIKRQLFLAIILISVFALIGSVISSTYNLRVYLIQQLQLKNQDNANALAISLSQSESDLVKIKLEISAQFDTGNYEKIWFEDNKGQLVVEKATAETIKNIPDWFIHAIPLDVPTGQAKVTKGWRQLGTVYLISQKQYAYESLWKSMIESIWVSFLSVAIGLFLAKMIINQFKDSLEGFINQVKGLPERKFPEESLSRIVEFKGLNEAMNASSRQLKDLFDAEAKQIESLKQDLNYDSLTGLMNRNFVISKLKESLGSDEIGYNGCAIFRLLNLYLINQQNGRDLGDRMLKILAQHLNVAVLPQNLGFVGRLSGSDFLVVFASDNAETWLEKITTSLLETIKKEFSFAMPLIAIGLTDLHHGELVNEALSRADIALATSEMLGRNKVSVKHRQWFNEGNEYANNVQDYFALINQALLQKNFKLLSHPVVKISGEIIHVESPLQIVLAAGGLLSAGKFLPIAERMGISPKLDLMALSLALDKLEKDKDLIGCAVNISCAALLDVSFMTAMKEKMGSQALLSRLWIDIPETFAIHYPSLLMELSEYLHARKVRIGIKHLSERLDEIGQLKLLGVDYIKVDAALVRNLSTRAEIEVMLERLIALTHQVGLAVYAEGVETDSEIHVVKKLNFDGMTGKGVTIKE